MAGGLLAGHRTQLVVLANRVTKRKVLDGEEVRAVFSAGRNAASENAKEP